MNFVDPKEYNYPGLVRKNRYKTILPSEYSSHKEKNTLCRFYKFLISLYCKQFYNLNIYIDEMYLSYAAFFTIHLSLLLMVISHCPPADTHSRVILKSQDEDDFLTTYINANYLKVSEYMNISEYIILW